MGEQFIEDELLNPLGKGVAPPRCRNELIGGAIRKAFPQKCIAENKPKI